VAPRDRTIIEFASAQAMVDAIWSDMDLRYPPAVERLSRRVTTTIASANRLSLWLPERTPAWCLLHEIAHAMSTTVDGRSDGHGPVFMGLYARLLIRYLRLDEACLLASLREAGISIASGARPVFVDPPASCRRASPLPVGCGKLAPAIRSGDRHAREGSS
jgi:hypothetical protein